jgi:hypothetical protein
MGMGGAAFWPNEFESTPIAFVLPVFTSMFFALYIGASIYRQMASCRMELTSTELRFTKPGFFEQRHVVLKTADIVAIGAWEGLRVADKTGRITQLLEERSLPETESVAAALRSQLNVPDTLSPSQNEVAVTYVGTFWDSPVTALLSVRPGEMTLRHSLASKPHLRFRSGAVYPNTVHDAITLSEADARYGTGVDGRTYLDIAPRDVRCSMREDGSPKLDIGLVGNWGVSIVLPLGISSVTSFAQPKPDFTLRLQCDDPEALPRALVRFWGGGA